VERLAELSDLFAIDLCAYAVMSNHCHLVVRLDPETAENWPEEEVMARWERLFSVARAGSALSDGANDLAGRD
jgi:putative transposase